MSQFTQLPTLYIVGYVITLIYLATIMSDRIPAGMIRASSIWMSIQWFVRVAMTAFYVDKLRPLNGPFLTEIVISAISFCLAAAMVVMAKEIWSSSGLYHPLGFFYGILQIIATHIWDRTITKAVTTEPYSMTYFCVALWCFGVFSVYRFLDECVHSDGLRHLLQVISAVGFICLAVIGYKLNY